VASNKNQHFVPRCYLRPFTHEGANAAINLFNVDRLRFIEHAPVKNQCSGDYFYGADLRLEKALQELEAEYADALRRILHAGYELSEDDRLLLLRFWLLQHLRTESASARSVEMAASLRETLEIPAHQFNLGIKEAVQIAMQAFVSSIHSMDDLKLCLVRNRSKTPFVTSDDPAVLTNRWYFSGRRIHHGSFGLPSSGALTILPLSPDVLCLGYDGDVYSIQHERGWVEVRSDRDVASLNEHQYLNCRANIFVRERTHGALVAGAYRQVAQLRPQERYRLTYAVEDRQTADTTRYRIVSKDQASDNGTALVHSQIVHAQPSMWPSQVRFRHAGAIYTNGSAVGYVRLSATMRQTARAFVKERP
jgi:hypothetical protein